MRTVFMGTPDFAVEILRGILETKKHEVVGVVTQPDKPQGRKGILTPSPVKVFALEQGLKVYQPQKVKADDFVEILKELSPEVIVVAAYGQILSEVILNLPKYGCINVHGSLLPKYRGAAPVQYAILNGDKETGVTIMQMDKGMDTGAMLSKTVVPIGEDMTTGELMGNLAQAGSAALVEMLDKLSNNEAVAEPQKEDEATCTHLIKREMEVLDWQETAAQIHNKIRALNPTPGAYAILPNGKHLKIWKSKIVEGNGVPGKILKVEKDGFVVACGAGALKVLQVQPEGKKSMGAKDFLNGGMVKDSLV